MAVIVFNFFLTFLFFFVYLLNDKYMNKYYVFICYVYIFSFAAFQTGSPDFDNYRAIFYQKYERPVEPVYSFVTSHFSAVISNFSIFVLFQAAIVTLLLFLFLRSFSKDQRISIIMYINLYYPLKQLIQVRSLIAILIVFIGLKYIHSKIKYLSTVLLGSGFHISVALFAFVPFFKGLRKSTLLFFIALSFIFVKIPVSTFLTHMPFYGLLPAYYQGWLQSESFLGITLYHVARMCLTILLFSFVVYQNDDKVYKLFFFIFITGCIIRFAFAQYFFFSSRMSDVFFFSEIVLFSYISQLKSREVKYLVLSFFVINSLLMLLLFEKNNSFISTYSIG